MVRGNSKLKGTYKLHYTMPNMITIGCNRVAHANRYAPVDTAWDYSLLDFGTTEDALGMAVLARHDQILAIFRRQMHRSTGDTTSESSADEGTDPEAISFVPRESSSRIMDRP